MEMVDGVKKENKTIRITSNFLFIVFILLISFFIIATAQSRLTGKEPSILGHRLYIVESGSMLPTLKVNSMIVVKEIAPEEIQIGDMVSYYGENTKTRVTHRVVDIKDKGNTFITRGDANNVNDSNPLEKDRVIGKVIFSIPFLGFIFELLSKPVTIFLLAIMGIAWIVIPKLIKSKI